MMTQNNKQPKKLVTHNGSFHTDDVFAAATLSIYLEKHGESYNIIRTRDEEIIKNGDYVFDVGTIYNEAENRFDHHQPGGAGKRDNDIEYSSFGLVWRKFGKELSGGEKEAQRIEKNLVMPVDAFDNGMTLAQRMGEISPYLIQQMFFAMRPTWQEDEALLDEFFIKSVGLAKEILKREIKHAQDSIRADEIVKEFYNQAEDKKIIVMDYKYPFEILSSFPEPLFIVFPRKNDAWWGIECVRNDPKTFISRKALPKSWAGLRDEELQKDSGVSDAIFCHRGVYMAVAGSKEGAITLAHKALEI